MRSKENTLVEVSRLATSEGDPIPELGKELISLQGPLASVDGVKSLSFLSVQEQYAEIVEEAYHREKESKPRTKHFTEEPYRSQGAYFGGVPQHASRPTDEICLCRHCRQQ